MKAIAATVSLIATTVDVAACSVMDGVAAAASCVMTIVYAAAVAASRALTL